VRKCPSAKQYTRKYSDSNNMWESVLFETLREKVPLSKLAVDIRKGWLRHPSFNILGPWIWVEIVSGIKCWILLGPSPWAKDPKCSKESLWKHFRLKLSFLQLLFVICNFRVWTFVSEHPFCSFGCIDCVSELTLHNFVVRGCTVVCLRFRNFRFRTFNSKRWDHMFRLKTYGW